MVVLGGGVLSHERGAPVASVMRTVASGMRAEPENPPRCWELHPSTLNPQTSTLNPRPETQNSRPQTQNPKPKSRNPNHKAQITKLKHKTQNTKPKPQNPKPETQNPKHKRVSASQLDMSICPRVA